MLIFYEVFYVHNNHAMLDRNSARPKKLRRVLRWHFRRPAHTKKASYSTARFRGNYTPCSHTPRAIWPHVSEPSVLRSSRRFVGFMCVRLCSADQAASSKVPMRSECSPS